MLWLDKSRIDDPSAAVVAEGLYALTPVATPQGWVRAGSLLPGAEVMTFDGGPLRIASVSSHRLDTSAPRAAWQWGEAGAERQRAAVHDVRGGGCRYGMGG